MLTGPGGIGKTHLAIHHLVSLLAEKQQVAFVALASVNGREQTVPAVADLLGIVRYAVSDRPDQPISYLQDEELILVLDNFEHLSGDSRCVDLVGDILRRACNIKLIITSRLPLQLQTERAFEMQGLSVPKTQNICALQGPGCLTTHRSQRRYR